jgi:sialidase-like protein
MVQRIQIFCFMALVGALYFSNHLLLAQTGSVNEPVRYIGGGAIDPNVHDGRLRPPVGVHSHQTLRVNRTHPELADDYGWTYNHASNLAYWNGTFYQQYLSNPVDEHIAPGQTLITTSSNGMDWKKPIVVFPPYEPPAGTKMPSGSNGYMMHQRMGFYVAPKGRLLVSAFYGHAEDPFRHHGIGRVVREAYADGSYGPIYFIRYCSHAHWNQTNTSYPFYRASPDPGFVQACAALLADKLITRQWWDEDRGMDGFYPPIRAGQAFCFYHRQDGTVVGLWKRSTCALSTDQGATFSTPVKSPTFIMAGGKQWGQATDDGRYAIVYNPIEMDEHRYPLIMLGSDDGIIFDNMLVVQGEVPGRRFFGRWKDYGPCYVRGIVPGNGNPPGDDLWLTYSMNKEDMWVSRVPVPATDAVSGPVVDDFQTRNRGGRVDGWNIYDPIWAPVAIAEQDGNQYLQLQDKDPYDYGRAVRVFQEGTSAKLSFRVQSLQADHGLFEIDVNDRYGNRPVRIRFDTDGQIKADQGGATQAVMKYEPGHWYQLEIDIAANPYGHFSLSINGQRLLEKTALAVAVKSVERISFRTGAYRNYPTRKTDNEKVHPPLLGADEPVDNAIYRIDDVKLEAE